MLPSEGNWSQFRRKVREDRSDVKELDARLQQLTTLLESSRTTVRRRLASRANGASAAGIVKYFRDFVDIVEPWQELFDGARTLDLVVMYSSSWRNTYLKCAREMLHKPRSRVRIVLPAANPSLLRAYAARLDTRPDVIASRIKDAFIEFKDLGKYGNVEIYKTTYYMNHALYLFDSAGIFAYYSFRIDRCPTPAVLIENGDLLDFARKDFSWLVSPENPASKLVFTSTK